MSSPTAEGGFNGHGAICLVSSQPRMSAPQTGELRSLVLVGGTMIGSLLLYAVLVVFFPYYSEWGD